MRRFFATGPATGLLLVAAALALVAGPAEAARITVADLAARNLELAAAPVLVADPATALLGAGTVSVSGTAGSGETVTVSGFGPFGDTGFTLSAGSLIGDGLLGTSTLVASEAGFLDLLIEGITATGSFSGISRALVTVTTTLGDPIVLGAGFLPALDPTATITVTPVNQIPLPAGLVLMITAIGGLAALRSQKRR